MHKKSTSGGFNNLYVNKNINCSEDDIVNIPYTVLSTLSPKLVQLPSIVVLIVFIITFPLFVILADEYFS